MRVSIRRVVVVHHMVEWAVAVAVEEIANAMAIVSLPRMNCATYSSNSGFVYASVPECIV